MNQTPPEVWTKGLVPQHGSTYRRLGLYVFYKWWQNLWRNWLRFDAVVDGMPCCKCVQLANIRLRCIYAVSVVIVIERHYNAQPTPALTTIIMKMLAFEPLVARRLYDMLITSALSGTALFIATMKNAFTSQTESIVARLTMPILTARHLDRNV